MLYSSTHANSRSIAVGQASEIRVGNLPARFQSKLSLENPFIGEYFDDFSLAVFTHGGSKLKVLVLGGGLGSCVRPMYAIGQVASIVSVDANSEVSSLAQTLYKEHFPKIPVSIVTDDAENFLARTQEKFDIIWIDLFDDQGYAGALSNSAFFNSARARLGEGGIIAINVYGLPTYLLPFSNENPLTFFTSQLQECFDLSAFLHRKNATLICRKDKCQNTGTPSSIPLTPEDRATIQLLSARTETTLQPITGAVSSSHLRFHEIQAEEKAALQRFMDVHGKLFEESSRVKAGLAHVFRKLVEQKDEAAQVYPIVMAAQSRSEFVPISEITLVVDSVQAGLVEMGPEFLINSVFSHLLAIACPSADGGPDQRPEFFHWLENFKKRAGHLC